MRLAPRPVPPKTTCRRRRCRRCCWQRSRPAAVCASAGDAPVCCATSNCLAQGPAGPGARPPPRPAGKQPSEAAAAAAGALTQGQPLLAPVVAKYRASQWTRGWHTRGFHQAQPAGPTAPDLVGGGRGRGRAREHVCISTAESSCLRTCSCATVCCPPNNRSAHILRIVRFTLNLSGFSGCHYLGKSK